jgi:hypothetical protein
MEAVRYISIDYVLEQLQRRNKWLRDVNYYDVCEYVEESYGLIGAPQAYIEQVTGNSLFRPNVKVEDWAGELPPDLIRINPGGVRDADNGIVYRYATGSFHKTPAFVKENSELPVSDKTYSIRNGYIYINDQEATLQISYKAIPVDDKGFPMIVDKPRFRKAIEAAILYHEGWKLASINRLSKFVWQELDQNYHWWIASASTESKMFHPDEAESFKNAWQRLYPKINFQQSSFKYAGVQEDLRIGRNSASL